MIPPVTGVGRVPADPAQFVAAAERITNDRDADAAAAVYAQDAVLELVTDGARERYTGAPHIRSGWRALMAAMARRGLVVRKTLLAAGDGVVVNEWTGSLTGSGAARGIDIWAFDEDGRVREHRLYTFLRVRPSTAPLMRVRMVLTSPATALAVLREQRRVGVVPGR